MTAIAPKMKKAGAVVVADPAVVISVACETWRFRAYVAFWGMCFFAITISRIIVKPILLAGPPADEYNSSCPPYSRNNPDLGAGGVYPGKGFDLSTQSHLVELFGFGNICTNWDYSPSRELTAMVYPLFEYSLIVYLVLDFLATTLSYKRGELTEGFWAFSKIIFPLNIVLCSQFRMIFVCLAYENVKQHTAGFLGLQIALILVALQNTGFIWDAEIAYPSLGGIKGTRRAALAYIICDLCICFFKIRATIFVVMNGAGAPWTMKPSPMPGRVMGQFVDIIWMIFNAVIPLVISHFRARNEHPLKIKVTQDFHYVDSSIELTGEKKAFKSGGGYRSKYETVVQDEVL